MSYGNHTYKTYESLTTSQVQEAIKQSKNNNSQGSDKLNIRHRTTNTTQAHIPSSKSERNLIILHTNINGLKNRLEELKLLIQDIHADIITIQETKLTLKSTHPK